MLGWPVIVLFACHQAAVDVPDDAVADDSTETLPADSAEEDDCVDGVSPLTPDPSQTYASATASILEGGRGCLYQAGTCATPAGAAYRTLEAQVDEDVVRWFYEAASDVLAAYGTFGDETRECGQPSRWVGPVLLDCAPTGSSGKLGECP
jgi:hypothetical protein